MNELGWTRANMSNNKIICSRFDGYGARNMRSRIATCYLHGPFLVSAERPTRKPWDLFYAEWALRYDTRHFVAIREDQLQSRILRGNPYSPSPRVDSRPTKMNLHRRV